MPKPENVKLVRTVIGITGGQANDSLELLAHIMALNESKAPKTGEPEVMLRGYYQARKTGEVELTEREKFLKKELQNKLSRMPSRRVISP